MAKKKRGSNKHFKGKPLFYLLEKLPNNGVGRLIIRGSNKQDENAPTYMRILEVNMVPVEMRRKRNRMKQAYYDRMQRKIRISVKVEKTFRGITVPKPVDICSTSYLADFILIPKEDEDKYIKNSVPAFNKGYFFYTSAQKKRIKEAIAGGMLPVEAKQIERERAAREELEEAERKGITPRKINCDQEMDDNYDDDDDEVEDDDEEEDQNKDKESQALNAADKNCANSNENKKEANVAEKSRPKQQNNASNNNKRKNDDDKKNNSDSKKRRYDDSKSRNSSDNNRRRTERSSRANWYVQEKFGDFTEDQMSRINYMITKGMNPDTAKQIEWERGIAFKTATENEVNKVEAKSDTNAASTATCDTAIAASTTEDNAASTAEEECSNENETAVPTECTNGTNCTTNDETIIICDDDDDPASITSEPETCANDGITT